MHTRYHFHRQITKNIRKTKIVSKQKMFKKCLKENRNLICAQDKQHQHTHNNTQHNKLQYKGTKRKFKVIEFEL